MGRGEVRTIHTFEAVALIHHGNVDASGGEVPDRMVSVKAATHRGQLRAIVQTDDLLSETYAADRPLSLQFPEELHRFGSFRSACRAVGEEYSVGIVSENVLCRHIERDDSDVAASLIEDADDIVLDAAVHRHNVESLVRRAGKPPLAAAHLRYQRGRARGFRDEFQGIFPRNGCIDYGGHRTSCPAYYLGKHSGIYTADAGYVALHKFLVESLGIAEVARCVAAFAHDDTAD